MPGDKPGHDEQWCVTLAARTRFALSPDDGRARSPHERQRHAGDRHQSKDVDACHTIRVMAGRGDEALLRADVPAIHVLRAARRDVDARDKPGHDGGGA